MFKARTSLLLCAVLLCSWPSRARAAGKHAPDPGFKSLDGQTRKLSALRGQVVVVNFWATWCGPCQEELPRLAKLAESYGASPVAGRPVRFVLISIDEPKNRPKIPTVLDRLHVPLESWDDADTDTMDRFGLGNIVPGTAILDEHGEIVARIMGEAREEDVRTVVDWLLAGRSGPAPPPLTKRY
jgi:thiol-disulfide isomerase/thioredoxin